MTNDSIAAFEAKAIELYEEVAQRLAKDTVNYTKAVKVEVKSTLVDEKNVHLDIQLVFPERNVHDIVESAQIDIIQYMFKKFLDESSGKA